MWLKATRPIPRMFYVKCKQLIYTGRINFPGIWIMIHPTGIRLDILDLNLFRCFPLRQECQDIAKLTLKLGILSCHAKRNQVVLSSYIDLSSDSSLRLTNYGMRTCYRVYLPHESQFHSLFTTATRVSF